MSRSKTTPVDADDELAQQVARQIFPQSPVRLYHDQLILRGRVEGYLQNHDLHPTVLRMGQLARALVFNDHGPFVADQGAIGHTLRGLGWRPHRLRCDPKRPWQVAAWSPVGMSVRPGRPRKPLRAVEASRPWEKSKPWVAAGMSRRTWFRRRAEFRITRTLTALRHAAKPVRAARADR